MRKENIEEIKSHIKKLKEISKGLDFIYDEAADNWYEDGGFNKDEEAELEAFNEFIMDINKATEGLEELIDDD